MNGYTAEKWAARGAVALAVARADASGLKSPALYWRQSRSSDAQDLLDPHQPVGLGLDRWLKTLLRLLSGLVIGGRRSRRASKATERIAQP